MITDYEVTEWVDVSNNSWIRNVKIDEKLHICCDSQAGSIFVVINDSRVGCFSQYDEEISPMKLFGSAKAIDSIPEPTMKEILQICVCEYEYMVKLGCALEE